MFNDLRQKFLNLNAQAATRLSMLILFLGGLGRSYGLFDHWKTHDHYNYGGVMIQVWVRCIKEIPFDISWGRLMNACDPNYLEIYRNHSPLFMWPLWGLTYILGEGEWVMRSYYMFFSLTNVLLVFLLARRFWPEKPSIWVLATFFQSFFLSGLYLGTHPENICEITLTFMLISAHFTLSRRPVWACLFAILAGMMSWVGYFQFAPILLYAWSRRESFRTVLWMTVFGVFICYLQIVYLRGTFAIWDFVGYKLSNPEYVRPQSSFDILTLPFRFLKSFLTSQSRMLGPLFATWAFFELIFGFGKRFWTIRRDRLGQLSLQHWAVIIAGFGGLAYLVPGFRYAMVHFFNYVFLMPMYALACGIFAEKLLRSPEEVFGSTHRKWLLIFGLVFIIVYPYGIFKSRPIHDAVNSVVLPSLAIFFLVRIFRKTLSAAMVLPLITVGALANFSQVVNYRNEPDTEYPFCEWARKEYERTGLPVKTRERKTMAKEKLYCRGIPIEYETPENP